MNVGVASCESNPNSSWLSGRGSWVSYCVGVVTLHLVLASVPILESTTVWTLTNLTHNLLMYLILHTIKGAPWQNTDQGKSRRLTHWEQIDAGLQFTDTRKFLTVFPIGLFMVTSYFTDYQWTHFMINVSSMVIVLIPKLPQFHKYGHLDLRSLFSIGGRVPTSETVLHLLSGKLISSASPSANRLACNMVVIDKHVVLNQGNDDTCRLLEKAGFTAHQVDVSEFVKAGGACKCLSLRID